MLECGERLSEKWAARFGQAVKLHIGVHTGPVVAGSLGNVAGAAYAVSGDTVNTTARLLAAASGTILVSGATYALTQHRFVFDRATVAGIPLTTVDLSPLRVEDARTICEAVVNDPEVVSGVMSRAGGNPLFLEQLLHHVNEGERDSVPGTIQSLVQSTVDQLNAEDRKTVQTASVIGQRVDPSRRMPSGTALT
jgi:hypothetical protein